MKYKSELIHEILEQRGHEKSTLHYQSECVKSWVDETKGAYPKLCDYESEWLNYIYEDPIGEFPYETVSTNSMTTVNNVVPFAYKSAILLGNTLVNISRFTKMSVNSSSVSVDDDGWVTVLSPTGDYNNAFYGVTGLEKPNTQYTLILEIKKNTRTRTSSFIQITDYYPSVFNITQNISIEGGFVGTKKFLLTTKEDLSDCLVTSRTFIDSSGGTLIFRQVLIEGDYTDVDIPYFEGMTSCKMPVLTTTGKNLLNISPDKIERVSIDSSTGAITESDTRCATKYIKATPKDDLFLKRFNTDYKVAVRYYHNNQIVNTKLNNWGGFISDGNLKVVSNDYYNQIRLIFAKTDNSKITPQEASSQQIMLSRSQSDVFEPYKSNILTVNEDVELGSVGNVYDTLDLLTGDVISRTGLYTYKGEIEPYFNQSIGGYVVNVMANANVTLESGIISDKFINRTFTDYDTGVYGNNNGSFYFFDKLVTSAQEFKEKYIGTNFRFELKEKSIKTVDLTVVNQDGEPLSKIKPIEGTMHIEVSGSPIAPTAVLEVPVEAITQNLNSFIEEE